MQFPVSQAAANENNAIQLNRRGRLVQVKFTRWCEIPVACKPRRARWQALRRGQALKQCIGGDCRRSEPLLLGLADVAAQQLHVMHCAHPVSVERIHCVRWPARTRFRSDQGTREGVSNSLHSLSKFNDAGAEATCESAIQPCRSLCDEQAVSAKQQHHSITGHDARLGKTTQICREAR